MDVNTTDKSCERKEVVVIGMHLFNFYFKLIIQYIFSGNGPSAIILSYLLSGHIPYWNGCPVSNDYLNIKLEQYVKDSSLLEQVRCV